MAFPNGRAVRVAMGILLAATPLLVVPVWPPRLIVGSDPYLLSVANLAAVTAIVANLAAVTAIVATATGAFIHQTGLPSLVQAGLWGVGGYACAIAAGELGLGFWLSLGFAALTPALVALPVAIVSLRTSGMAFLVVTLAFSEFIVLVLANLEVTGGPGGMPVGGQPGAIGPLDFADPLARYYLYCGFLGVTLAVCWAVGRSTFGARLHALRDNEQLARSLGLRPLLYRLAAFEISAALVGIAGALLAYQLRVITPDLFGALQFIDVYLAILLGGLAVVDGPAVGAWIVVFLPLWLGFSDPNTSRLLFGGSLVAVMLLAPRGLLGLVHPERPRPARRRSAPSPVAATSTPRPQRGPSLRPEPTVLQIDGLRRSFGAVRALDGVDLAVGGGEILGLIGPNGSGKTTLLNCISGFLRPTAGSVTLCGERIEGRAPDAIARAGVVRTFQEPQSFASITPRASCELVARLAGGRGGRPDRQGGSAGAAVLHAFRLEGLADVAPEELSHGQLRMLTVALALCRCPRVLLLDEPAAGLTAADRDALREVIEMAATETAVVVVEHDMSFLLPICDRLMVLDRGRVLAEGTPDAVCADDRVIGAYLGEPYVHARIPAASDETGPR